MIFADIHIHLLCGVDDGPKNIETMQEMLKRSYAEGVRVICATPHYHPGYFGDNGERSEQMFNELWEWAECCPDMLLCLGNEMRYSSDSVRWLQQGECRTLNNSRYVLVDFAEDDSSNRIIEGNMRLLNAGYCPVLAHAERYANLHKDFREILYLREQGVVIQMDADSPFGGWDRDAKRRSVRMISEQLVDIVSTDAHDLCGRPPGMLRCFEYVSGVCGNEYAQKIFGLNPMKVLADKALGKDVN